MLSAVLCSAMVSCSSDEIENINESKQNAIGFNIVNNGVGRAAIVDNTEELQANSFNVYAFTKDGDAYMGSNDTEDAYNGIGIAFSNGAWNYINDTDLRYWPTEALDFYAVTPGTKSVTDKYSNIATLYGWNFNATTQTIKYTSFDEYAADNTPDKRNYAQNIDVMYAIAKDQTKNTNAGKVNFQFRHILSQVVFLAKTELANFSVDINEVKLHNFIMGGVFTLPATHGAETQSSWTLTTEGANNGHGTFTVTPAGAGINVNSNVTTTSISLDKPLLLVPQNITKWDVTAGSIPDLGATGSYLEISCKIKQNGLFLLGSAEEWKTIYVPFEASLLPGKRHIFTLVFGGGYDKDGNEILTPITFDAEVTDWADQNEPDIAL